MAVNAFLVGLRDSKLVEHLLTQGPKTCSEAERIAMEFFQLRRSLARPGDDRSRRGDDDAPAYFVGARSNLDDCSLEETNTKNLQYSGAELFEPSLLVENNRARRFKKSPRTRSHSGDGRRPPAGLMSSSQARPKTPPGQNRNNSPGRKPVGEIKCFKCGGIGHTANKCPSPVICFRCRQPGHVQSNCRNPPAQRPKSENLPGPNGPESGENFANPDPLNS